MQTIRLVTMCCLAWVVLVSSRQTAQAQSDEPPSVAPPASRDLQAMPLTTPGYSYEAEEKPLTIFQQRAMFAANQRMLRMEFNNWIGHSPLRPNINASYMSQGSQRYYLPSRGVILSFGGSRSWYW